MTDELRHPLGTWGSSLELEVRRRIQVSIAAYAYEIESNPVMSDALYDWFAERVRPRMGTCHPLLDEFFVVHFTPMTGMWIHQHPQLDRIRHKYIHHGDAMRAYFAQDKVQKLLHWGKK